MKRGIIWIAGLLFCVQAAIAQAQPMALSKGSKAPDFTSVNQHHQAVSLNQLLEKGPVVLVFYRGYWCPFCNRQLKQLQDSLPMLKKHNAQVVAISPESVIYVNNTIDKTGATYQIISDANNSIMKRYKVAYEVDASTNNRLKNIGVDLQAVNASNDAVLPVPAVYIINQKGVIHYAFFDHNYRNRPSVKTLLEQLDQL